MANSDKNIIITPYVSGITQPQMTFVGQGNDPIYLKVLNGITGTGATAGGALSIEGSAGQLFSVVNRLGTGSIFSVNDISGFPIIDVNANGTLSLAPSFGNVGVGLTGPTTKFQVTGNMFASGLISSTTGFSGSGTNLTNIVKTFNGLSGGVTLAAGTNITLTPVGNTITIASSGGGGGSSVYGVTASLDFSETINGLEIIFYGTGLDYFTSLQNIENDVNALYVRDASAGDDWTTDLISIKSFYDATNGWSARIIVKPIFANKFDLSTIKTAEELYTIGIQAILINLKSTALDEFWENIVSTNIYHQEETYVTKTLTGITWVTNNMFLNCKVLGLTSADHTAEDAILEGVNFEINNILGGTGFDIIGHAPEGTYGKYTIKCLGQ